jgi:hypothetical protein
MGQVHMKAVHLHTPFPFWSAVYSCANGGNFETRKARIIAGWRHVYNLPIYQFRLALRYPRPRSWRVFRVHSLLLRAVHVRRWLRVTWGGCQARSCSTVSGSGLHRARRDKTRPAELRVWINVVVPCGATAPVGPGQPAFRFRVRWWYFFDKASLSQSTSAHSYYKRFPSRSVGFASLVGGDPACQ